MSLVAYGSDSDSDSNEDQEENTVATVVGQVKVAAHHQERQGQSISTSGKKSSPSLSSPSTSVSGALGTHTSDDSLSHNIPSGYISDEEEYETVSSTSTSVDSHIFSSKTESHSQVNSTSITSLDDLPAPVTRAAANSDVEEEDLEDEVKPKAAEIASAPKPPGKKTRQPVKIAIPSLDDTPEEEPVSKKTVSSSSSKPGLFALLPAPVHSSKKEINRALIPHSLSKKPAPKKPVATKKPPLAANTPLNEVASSSDSSLKRMSQFNALTGYDSDSDDDNHDGDNDSSAAANFFSLDSSSSTSLSKNTLTSAPPLPSTSSRLQSEEISSSKSDTILAKPGGSNADTSNNYLFGSGSSSGVTGSDSKEEVEEEEPDEQVVEAVEEPGAVNDAPLDFGSKDRLRAWSNSSHSFLTPVGPSGPVTSYAPQYAVPSYQMPSNSLYNLANPATSMVTGEVEDTGEVPNEDLKQFMGDREFQRLQGKRKRGMEEAISFVDAKVDDYVDPSDLSKHLTEESEYSSHKSKDNLPTSQQKRKKQITYLAFQAKEKELELKNQWANNKMTKMQTQSKYGF